MSNRYLAHFIGDGLTTVEDDFSLDAVVQATQAGSASLDAVIQATQAGSFGLDAVIVVTVSGSFTLDAVLLATQATTFSLDAVVLIEQSASFGLDAVIVITVGGSFALDAVVLKEQASSTALDAVVQKEQSASFGLDAVVQGPAVVVTSSFSLDAWIIGGVGQHSREDDHFATQPDSVITVTGLSGYADGTLLPIVLASLFNRAADLGAFPSFGLDAVIAAPATTPRSGSFGLDARVAYGGTIGLDAVIQRPWNVRTFGLNAVIAGTQPWNLVRTPVGGAEASFSAISSQSASTGPEQAADGARHYNFFGEAWEKTFWTAAPGDWWQVSWMQPQTINRVVIYNTEYTFGPTGYLVFSDGSQVAYTGLSPGGDDASFVKTIDFPAKVTSSLRLVANEGTNGNRRALAEVEAFNTEQYD